MEVAEDLPSGCHVADFQFPARENPAGAFKEWGESERGRAIELGKRETAKRVPSIMAIGVASSDCRGSRRCEMHADSIVCR